MLKRVMSKVLLVLLIVMTTPSTLLGQNLSQLQNQKESLDQESADLREERSRLRSEVDSLEILLEEAEKSDLSALDSLIRGAKIEVQKESHLRASTGYYAEELLEIEEGDEVEVLSYKGSRYVLVDREGEQGWLRVIEAFGTSLSLDRLISDAIGVSRDDLEQARGEANSPDERVVLLRSEIKNKQLEISNISRDIKSKQRAASRAECKMRFGNTALGNKACRGGADIGMTKRMIFQAWGDPKDVNRTRTARGMREQWVYGSIRNRRYIYFEDGIVTAIQD